jgi:hypothetical protein
MTDWLGLSSASAAEQAYALAGAIAGFAAYMTLRMGLQALFGGLVLRRSNARKRKGKGKAKREGRR